MADQDSIAKHFSKGSEVYEQEASLQREIAHELFTKIKVKRIPEYILDVGCGTGFLTSLLMGAFPKARIEAIDLSGDMVRKAQVLIGSPQITWLKGDAADYEFGRTYDVVASSSAIQWIYPQKMLFGHLFHVVNPGGKLYFSLMLRGTLKELHELRHKVAPHKPLRAELASAADIGGYLKATGFSVSRLEEKIYRREYASAADFLWRIKEQGFTGGEISTADKPLTRGELRELSQAYQSAYRGSQGGVYATYCVGYFEAWR
jgi:malonyl-CoA O-methyltransferase